MSAGRTKFLVSIKILMHAPDSGASNAQHIVLYAMSYTACKFVSSLHAKQEKADWMQVVSVLSLAQVETGAGADQGRVHLVAEGEVPAGAVCQVGSPAHSSASPCSFFLSHLRVGIIKQATLYHPMWTLEPISHPPPPSKHDFAHTW